MHACLKVSWFFNCCDGGSNNKTVKTKENSRCILDEMHKRLLYFLVICPVILMWFREKWKIELMESEIYQFVCFHGRGLLNTCIMSKWFNSVYDKVFYKRYVQQEWGGGSPTPVIPTVCYKRDSSVYFDGHLLFS